MVVGGNAGPRPSELLPLLELGFAMVLPPCTVSFCGHRQEAAKLGFCKVRRVPIPTFFQFCCVFARGCYSDGLGVIVNLPPRCILEGDAVEGTAVVESTGADGGDAFRDGDAFQGGAAIESIAAYTLPTGIGLCSIG